MPGQQKAMGYYTSTGTGLGFGERHDPLKDNPVVVPGVGTYNVTKDAENNDNPKWK